MKYFLTGLTVLLIAGNAQAVGWDETNTNPPDNATMMIYNPNQADVADQTEFTSIGSLKNTITGQWGGITGTITDQSDLMLLMMDYVNQIAPVGTSADPNTTDTAVIVTSHANGPDSDGSTSSWYITTYFYETSGDNAAQIAMPYIGNSTNIYHRFKNSAAWSDWVATGTEAANWGLIAGDITDQADLQAALGLKADAADVIPDAPSDSLTYGRNNGAWVQTTGGTGGIGEAPEDGTPYVRQDAGWVSESTGGGTGTVTGPGTSVAGGIATYDDTTGEVVNDDSGCTAINGQIDCSVLDGQAYIDIINSGAITATPVDGRLSVSGADLYIADGGSFIKVLDANDPIAVPTTLQLSLNSDNLAGETGPTADNIWIAPSVLSFSVALNECDGTSTGLELTIGYNAATSFGSWTTLGVINDFTGADVDISGYAPMAADGRVAVWVSSALTGDATECKGKITLTP